MDIVDEALALSFDVEVLTKARAWERDEMEKIGKPGGDPRGNVAALQANSKARFDEWIASLPEGHELRVKRGG